MTLRQTLVAAAAAAALTLSAGAAQAQNCMDVLSRTPDASDFVRALVRTGQTELLRGAGPFTILAPTNAAWTRVPVQFRNDVFGTAGAQGEDMDPVIAPAVVSAHIIDGKRDAASAQAGTSVITRNGNAINLVRGADGRIELQPQGRGRRAVSGHVVQADIACSNGVIHLVDTVLIRR